METATEVKGASAEGGSAEGAGACAAVGAEAESSAIDLHNAMLKVASEVPDSDRLDALVDNFKREHLKRECQLFGENVSGNKNQLAHRVLHYAEGFIQSFGVCAKQQITHAEHVEKMASFLQTEGFEIRVEDSNF